MATPIITARISMATSTNSEAEMAAMMPGAISSSAVVEPSPPVLTSVWKDAYHYTEHSTMSFSVFVFVSNLKGVHQWWMR